MSILVDTSVWADFFNGFASAEALTLARCIDREEDIVTCGVALAEFFQGLRRTQDFRRLEPFFRQMRLLAPREPDTYLAAAQLFRSLRERGVTIRSMVDCLIVQLADENACYMLAKDRDMRNILASGLVHVEAFT